MVQCSRCGGSGRDAYWEDERFVEDACYHCGETGVVDAETAFSDRLTSVMRKIAWSKAMEYRAARNADGEGDGFDFCAAENGLRPHDYLTEIAWSYEDKVWVQLRALPRETQEWMVAWEDALFEQAERDRAPAGWAEPADTDLPF
jgi:hypothetical protein